MLNVILAILLFLNIIFSPAAYGSTLTEDICRQATKYDASMELSNYENLRSVLSATDFINGLEFAPDSKYMKAAKLAANGTKTAIYIEDVLHTFNEIKDRNQDVLNSSNLANASDYPELYAHFKEYLDKTLHEWIPDRDYPQIGYLPKKFLFNQCLGERDITKYWPEASLHEQRDYVALTTKDLILNYELVWDSLRQGKNLS